MARKLLIRLIRQLNFTSEQAADGVEAVALIGKSLEDEEGGI